jgi:hypothetical protein
MGERGQVPGVRGSPLLRFIILAICLTATGFGLMRVTAAREEIPSPTAAPQAVSAKMAVPFQLLLSAPAQSVEIDTGTDFQVVGLRGTLDLDPQNPHVALRVSWKNPPAAGERRFAKLIIEAPGHDTISHVFDSSGDIDDYFELPISPAP